MAHPLGHDPGSPTPAPSGVTGPHPPVGTGGGAVRTDAAGTQGAGDAAGAGTGGTGLTPLSGAPPDEAVPQHVERVLADFLDRRRVDLLGIAPEAADAADALAGFVLGGGKRLRPVFAWWGWRGAGGEGEGPVAEQVLVAIGALELVQACALVHDDLMDASATRRGRPTVHLEFARLHDASAWSGPPARFGAAAAILVGDLAQVWADDMFRSAQLPAEAMAKADEPWRAMRTEVLAGQYLDVLAQASRDDTERAALRVNRFKTAAYTVERPLHLGAALAGAPSAVVDGYRRYGADIGTAFQLRDDLLGVFGDPQVTGKPAGDDLRQGKRTLLVALALDRARHRGDHEAAAVVRRAVGDPSLDDAGLERVREVLGELGAVAAVEQRIAALTGSALDALEGCRIEQAARSRLAELAERATSRQW